MLQLGYEWIYENMISYGGYQDFKKLQGLSKQWYQMLDQPWFRTEDKTRRKLPVSWYRNGLKIFNIENLKSTFDITFQHGPQKEYYPNGNVLEECIYMNGLKNGKSIVYCYNGNVGSITHYKDGKLDGPCKIYYDNGVVASEMNYRDGKLDGLHRLYDDDANLIEELTYINGIAI